MAFEIRWHCRQGNLTLDNRDHAGIGIRGDAILAIVLDGSSSGPDSGQFAREVARHMVDWFASAVQEVDADALTEQLRATHQALAPDFRADSASFALLHIRSAQPCLVLHAGDCLVGRRGAGGSPTWLMQPHTLANALQPLPIEVLAKEPARHMITRSFRANRFMMPDQLDLTALDDQPLLVATDGFWAELDATGQIAMLDGQLPPVIPNCDDCGVLLISRSGDRTMTEVGGVHPEQSLYLRRG